MTITNGAPSPKDNFLVGMIFVIVFGGIMLMSYTTQVNRERKKQRIIAAAALKEEDPFIDPDQTKQNS